MWKHLQLMLSVLSFMTFTTDSGEGEEATDGEGEEGQESTPPADRSMWTVDQWNAEIRRIAAKEKDEGRRAAEREAKEKQDKADADAALAKQESEGEYQAAKEKLTSDLESAQSVRDKALELLKANVDAHWNELPEEVKETYGGEEDDVLAKSSHMDLMKPIIDRLKADEASEEDRRNPGNRKGPKPTDKVTSTEEDEVAKRTVRPRL